MSNRNAKSIIFGIEHSNSNNSDYENNFEISTTCIDQSSLLQLGQQSRVKISTDTGNADHGCQNVFHRSKILLKY